MDSWRRAITSAEDPNQPRRLLLYDLYRQIMRDAHLKSQIETGKHKVVGSAFIIRDKQNEQADKDRIKLFQKQWFDKYCKLFLDADFWGHSLIEFQPMIDSANALMQQEFKYIKLIPREHVRSEAGEIVVNPYDLAGFSYRERPFSTWLMECGDPHNLGLLQIATREVIWKVYSRTDWSRRSEKFGMPTVIAMTTTRNEDELAKKEEFLANVGSSNYAILDDQDEVKFMESSQTNAHLIYQNLAEFCNEENSKLINGQTMTADDGSSRSQSEVHERILNTYTVDRMRRLSYHINDELFPFLIKHGYPLEGFEFQYLDFLDEEDDQDNTRKEPTPKDKQTAQKETLSFY